MNDKIGIGIIDIYEQEDLDVCYASIPEELKPNVFIVSATNNKPPVETDQYRKYGDVPMATLRNWLLSQFRINEYKYLFLLHSNQIIDDPKIFENTIKLGEVFGTWVVMGDGKNSLPLEDEESGVTLHASPELNSEFMFILSSIISNNGYFDERFFNTKDLDVMDYILKLRKKGVYLPNHYHPTIGSGVKKSFNTIKKIGFKDFPDTHRSVGLSYGYFVHNHKYIPGQNDPAGVTQEQLLTFLETLQKNYAKPIA
jgi:hypothetical protein